MKKIIFLFCFIVPLLTAAQTQKRKVTKTSISYKVTNAQELKNINWDSIKSTFKKNKENDIIEMQFALEYPKSKTNIKSSIKISGKSQNIDSLIIRAKKGIKSIIKISNKYKN